MASSQQLQNVPEPGQPLNDKEQAQIDAPSQSWDNSRAQTIAVNNFNAMESYRSQNHDWRFSNADQLFLAWTPQRTWENTRIPRSSIGIPVSMTQIEAMMPSIMSAMFPIADNLDVRPRPGSNAQQARAAFDLLMYQFDTLGEDGYKKLEEVIRLCLKQAFIYGNGILELGWQYKEVEEKYYYHSWVTPQRQILDPGSMQYINVPAGEPVCVPRMEIRRRKVNQPLIQCRDIRDFYIDPNCSSPSVQDARFCATRHLLTISEVKGYAGQEGFTLPSDAALVEMTKNKTFTRGDQSKRMTESYRAASYAPQEDYTTDPNQKRVEVIRYWDRQRTVWLLNRDWVLFNQGNPYGFLPFLDAFYVDVPGRFYGLAVTDVVEGEQRLQQSIINARIDELALTIHAPFAKKRGTALPQTSLRVAPGKVIELDDPKNDLVKLEYPNITQQAYLEVQASELRTQKYTGNSDLAILGTPTSGGNSANRTAAGINTQAAASGKRIQYIVANLQVTMIEPMCAMVHEMNRKFLSPTQALSVLGKEGQELKLDPVNVLNANVSFEFRAADKLRSRLTILQAMPMLLQTILNPEVMALLNQQQGLTVDIAQVMLMVTDALNVAPMSLFRPMTGQEQQAALGSNPQVQQLMAKMQMQKDRIEAQGIHQQDKGDTELLKTIFQQVMQNNGLQKALTGYSPEGDNAGATE